MPSAYAGRVRPGTGRRPGRRMLSLVLATVLAGGTACTAVNPSPPETGQTSQTGPISTSPSSTPSGASTSTTTSTTNPSGDFGSDHFTPFRTTVPNSAEGRRIGLIGLDQANPYSKLVSESIKEQATIAGAALVYCDAENNAEVALRCARRLAAQGVDAWVTFQPVISAGQSICGAGPKDVPMISIDSTQGNCQSTRVGIDDQWAGFTLGTELGRFIQRRFDCQVGVVVYLVDPTDGFVHRRRATGAGIGLDTICPAATDRPPPVQLEASGQDAAFAAVGKALTSIDKGQRVLIVGANDGLTLGAVGAARAAGRLDDVYVGGIGADPRSYCEIAEDPHWVGDVASFPEKYGQLVMPYLVDLMAGKPVPANLFVRNEFIDASTIGEHYDVSDCEQTP
ncbi:sugar ABC transporter substrate-binding protein [Nakamurella lactea]|uniref:sugar ABC transporter substrate-binding protein n=1 Tax=Nakamurella lactea TaxID=459515 RepID=UPI00040FA995|nr:substrate-binding domain-containing protein [Nakamurella lactea]